VVNEWISIKDQKPEYGRVVLTYTNDPRLCSELVEWAALLNLNGRELWVTSSMDEDDWSSLKKIKYWQPFPRYPGRKTVPFIKAVERRTHYEYKFVQKKAFVNKD